MNVHGLGNVIDPFAVVAQSYGDLTAGAVIFGGVDVGVGFGGVFALDDGGNVVDIAGGDQRRAGVRGKDCCGGGAGIVVGVENLSGISHFRRGSDVIVEVGGAGGQVFAAFRIINVGRNQCGGNCPCQNLCAGGVGGDGDAHTAEGNRSQRGVGVDRAGIGVGAAGNGRLILCTAVGQHGGGSDLHAVADGIRKDQICAFGKGTAVNRLGLHLRQSVEDNAGNGGDVIVGNVKGLVCVARAVVKSSCGGEQSLQVAGIVLKRGGCRQSLNVFHGGIEDGVDKDSVYRFLRGIHVVHAHADGNKAGVGIAVVKCLHLTGKMLAGQNGIIGNFVHADIGNGAVGGNAYRAVADGAGADDGVAVVCGGPGGLPVCDQNDGGGTVIGLAVGGGIGAAGFVAEHLIGRSDTCLGIGAAGNRHGVSGIGGTVAIGRQCAYVIGAVEGIGELHRGIRV